MADIFTKAKRSEVMSRIRGRGNKDTELALAKLFRQNQITGWRRQVQIGGRDRPLGRPQRSEGRNERGKIRVPAVRGRRLTLRSATGTAQRAVPTFRVRPDFVFPKLRLAVFVDGCFWHGCPRHATQPKSNRAFWNKKLSANKKRDALVPRVLRSAGWQVLRIWEHELTRPFQMRLRQKLQRALRLK
jgi:DNA mismatch endonuclease (patch repair protein)